MLTRSHTILFTEACPLACRYCYLKDGDSYGNMPLDEDEIFAEIDRIDKEDDPNEVISMLLLTGGEPFLYPDLVKKIITKYGNRFWYRFNTSGYLLTKDMLEFLSDYVVDFVLSVDGDERLTNYLRPIHANPYKTGYMKKLKEILPTLLYYFPRTPFRIIVAPRYVDCLHEMYLFAEQCGFRHFTFILDFESRPSKPLKGKLWEPKHTEILQQEINKIVMEILSGWAEGISRPMMRELDYVLQWAAKGREFSPMLFPCRVFDGRSNYTVASPTPSMCMLNYGTEEQVKKAIIEEYQSSKGCPNDPNCAAWDYCAQNCCPKNNIDAHGKYLQLEELDCALRRVSYYGAMTLLKFGQDLCSDSALFKQYLIEMGFGKEEGHGS